MALTSLEVYNSSFISTQKKFKTPVREENLFYWREVKFFSENEKKLNHWERG